MTQLKHTPGPWIATGFANLIVNDAAGNTLALAPGYGSGNKETAQANARLIAAAPELLAALQAMVETWEGTRERAAVKFAQHVVQARAAIAKATGEQR